MQNEQYGLTAQGEALPKFNQQAKTSLAKWLPLTSQHIEGKSVQTINARELHAFLKVGRDFSNWIKDRIAEYGFADGVDYVVFAKYGENPQGGRPQKEYAICLDMGKELAMVERNDEGRRARRYFIDCERRLAEVSPEQHALAMARWHVERAACKDYHAIMCRALQQHRTGQGKETLARHYGNEANMLNRLVLGMDAKRWAEKQGVTREVRQHMSRHQLELIAYLERHNATLIEAGMAFAERKDRLAGMLATHIEREGKR